MSDNFNIDELFEDSLGGMKQKPKEMSWDSIEQELDSSSPSDIQFDNLVAASMAGFSVDPSTNAWNGINEKLDNIDGLNKEFDSNVEESINSMNPQASKSVWSNIEKELDAMDAYRLAERNRFISWFSAAGAVAAVFIYFIMQVQPNISFKNDQAQLINRSVIDDSKQVSPKFNTTANTSNNEIIISKSENSISNEIVTLENSGSNIENNRSIENIVIETPIVKVVESSSDIDNKEIVVANTNIVENNSETNMIESNEIAANASILFNDIVNERMTNANLSNNERLLNTYAFSQTTANNLPLSIRSIKASTGFSIDLFGGPEFIHSPSEITYNEGDNISVKKKSSYIKDYSFGANIKYHYNNLFIQSGLVYSNFGDVFSLNQENEIHDTSGGYYSYNINTYYTYDTLGWDYDPLQPGVLVPILRSNIHTDTVITNWNSSDSLCYENELASAETRYRYIEIPLMLGYKFGYRDWDFLISAGASYGFKVADKAEYTSSNKLSNLDELSSPYSNSNINGIVSLGIAYSINDKISVVLQPTYKTNLTRFTAQSTRYHSLSLRCGINVKL